MVLKKSIKKCVFFRNENYGIFGGDDEFMGDYIRGVVVKLDLTPEQEVLFKKNYGCTRKVHNELLNKYKAKYGKDSTKIPTQKELNQFLMESKKELLYLRETESTSLQQARDDLHKAFQNSFKSKRHTGV